MRNQFWFKASAVLLFATTLFGANIPLNVLSVTSQQAEIQYASTISGPCTLSMTDNSGLGVTVWDVNALLTNASTDLARPDTLVSGSSRRVLLGHRVYEAGSDGRIYSRSLQADAPHTLTVACGADSGSLQFATRSIGIGQNYPELPQYCATGIWGHCWPTIDYSVFGKEIGYVDAFTGALVKRFSGPSEDQARTTVGSLNFTYYKDQSGTSAWTTPQSAVAYSAAGPYATSSTTGFAGKLFLGWGQFNDGGGNFIGGLNLYSSSSLDDIQVRMRGFASASSTSISACITLDAQTCYSPVVTCPTTTSSANINFGSSACSGGTWPLANWPGPFAGWGTMAPPPRNLLSAPAFPVSVSGSALIVPSPIYGNGTNFEIDTAPGSLIGITGSAAGSPVACANNLCTVASVTDSTHMTIVENPGSIGAQTAQPTAGILVWKASGSGTISLNAGFDVAFSGSAQLSGSGGEPSACSLAPPFNISVTSSGTAIAGPPHTGTLCGPLGLGSIYAFDETAGSARFLDDNYVFVGGMVSGNQSIATQFNPFSPTDPNTWFTYIGFLGAHNEGLMFQSTYNASAGKYQTNFAQWPSGAGNTIYPTTTQTIISPRYPNDIASKFAAYVPACCPVLNAAITAGLIGGGPSFQGFSTTGVGIFNNSWQQDTSSWTFTFDNINQVFTGAVDTTAGPNGRWAQDHSHKPTGGGGYVYAFVSQKAGAGLPSAFAAPYKMTIDKVWRSADGINGTWDTNTALADPTNETHLSSTTSPFNYAYTCPAGTSAYWTMAQSDADVIWLNSGGAAGTHSPFVGSNNCIQIHVTGPPCEISPPALEARTFPCPGDTSGLKAAYGVGSSFQNIAVGDTIDDLGCGGATAGTNCEHLVVVQITPDAANAMYLWLYRASQGGGLVPYPGPLANNSIGRGQLAHANGWTATMTYNGWGNGGQPWLLNSNNPSVGWYKDIWNLSGTHPDLSAAFPGAPSAYCALAGGGYACRPMINLPGDIGTLNGYRTTGYFPYFNGSAAFRALSGNLETYYSAKHQKASQDLKRWATDYHDPTAPTGTGFNSPEQVFSGSTCTVVSGFTLVYDCTLPSGSFVDEKNAPLYGLSGRYVLRNISGPGSVINNSTVNVFCWARVTGECFTSSTAGHVYVNAKAIEPTLTCYGNQLSVSSPCVVPTPSVFGQSVLNNIYDPNPEGSGHIRLTGMFNNPMNAAHYEHCRMVPDGSWCLQSATFAGAYRSDIFAVRIPKIAADTVNRTGFVQIPVRLPAGAPAQVRFGYDQSFRCSGVSDSQGNFISGYNDSCVTDGSGAQPFVWSTETQHTTSCTGGCTINIPAISGRFLYYRIERYSSGGVQTYAGPTQRLAVL